MKDRIEIYIKNTVNISSTEEPEKLTPLEKEISQGWMNVTIPESSGKRTRSIAEQLKRCKQEFIDLGIGAEVDFYEYIQHSYGIKLQVDYMGNVLPDYDVVDEKQFMIFKLKFSS